MNTENSRTSPQEAKSVNSKELKLTRGEVYSNKKICRHQSFNTLPKGMECHAFLIASKAMVDNQTEIFSSND